MNVFARFFFNIYKIDLFRTQIDINIYCSTAVNVLIRLYETSAFVDVFQTPSNADFYL